MGRFLITSIFAVIAIAIASETVSLLGDAVDEATLSSWLAVAYSVLKLAVAVAFTAFVLTRAPARRRTRDPVAYLACAAAIVPVALQVPADSASAGLVLGGEVLTLLGCVGMLVAALALGRCFGVLPEARGLVTHGPYRLVRHPLYLAELTAMGGLLVASPSPRNLALGAVFATAQAVRMRLEERALSAEFPEYASYASRTPRIVPSWHGLRGEPVLTWIGELVSARSRPERLPASERGQTLVEYALILSLVSIGSMAALTAIGVNLAAAINSVAQAV
jgi:protein-S-isoprenylcysteine O-methyltransferase Ste14/Flp pilus assembly pilin Flp